MILTEEEIKNPIMENLKTFRIWCLLKSASVDNVVYISKKAFYNFTEQEVRYSICKLEAAYFLKSSKEGRLTKIEINAVYSAVNNAVYSAVDKPLTNGFLGSYENETKNNNAINSAVNNAVYSAVDKKTEGNNAVYSAVNKPLTNGFLGSYENETKNNNAINSAVADLKSKTNTKTLFNKKSYSFSEFKERYNSELLPLFLDKSLTIGDRISDKQKSQIVKLLNKWSRQKVDEFFENVKSSSYLQGKVATKSGAGWSTTWYWITQPKVFEKVLNGDYKDYETPKVGDLLGKALSSATEPIKEPEKAQKPQRIAKVDYRAIQVWEATKKELAELVSLQEFNCWVKPIKAVAVATDKLLIEVPSDTFFKNIIQNELVQSIKMVLNQTLTQGADVLFKVKSGNGWRKGFSNGNLDNKLLYN